MSRIALLAVSLALASCRAALDHEVPTSTGRGVRIVPGELAREYSRQSIDVSVPFVLVAEGTSGTELVLDFLARADATGARYVSDLRLIIALRHDGKPIECTSAIDLVDRGPPTPKATTVAPTRDIYSTVVVPFRVEEQTTWVTDREIQCKGVPIYQQSSAPPAPPPRRARTKAEPRPAGTLIQKADQMQVRYVDECRRETVRRRVTRHAHFVAARLTPPDLALITRRYADRQLSLREPDCRAISEAELARAPHRVAATVHYMGSLGWKPEPTATRP